MNVSRPRIPPSGDPRLGFLHPQVCSVLTHPSVARHPTLTSPSRAFLALAFCNACGGRRVSGLPCPGPRATGSIGSMLPMFQCVPLRGFDLDVGFFGGASPAWRPSAAAQLGVET